ncbi:GNAT family N-acetyltransferase [Virgibacillus profundi]|uniref:GNAT family N-acetyltransferase n=1 Tax=Virgibacillus profundi TaxID=2024555 RepID=UPI001F0A52E1|nr:GNAT family N-acetyltransferase [Virgibacillus profundi]
MKKRSNIDNYCKELHLNYLVEVIQKAGDLGVIEQIYLTVVTTNASAKRLCSSFGFKVFGTEKNALKYNDTYFDEYHMVLFL